MMTSREELSRSLVTRYHPIRKDLIDESLLNLPISSVLLGTKLYKVFDELLAICRVLITQTLLFDFKFMRGIIVEWSLVFQALAFSLCWGPQNGWTAQRSERGS